MSGFAHLPATIRVGDFEVCRMGFGAMQLPGPHVWGEPKDPARARAVVRRVVELGINLIDTSWYYGPHVANRILAEVLHPYPKDLVLATKLGGKRTPDSGWTAALRPEELRAGCEEDLRTLKIERAHVTHLRWIPGTPVPFAESLGAMIDLQEAGKIGHIALSNVSMAQIREAIATTRIVAISNAYNVALKGSQMNAAMHAGTNEQEEIVDLCANEGMAFLPFFPLALPGQKADAPAVKAVAENHGVSEAQVALAWLLARSPAMLPIPGTSSPEHLEENWQAREIALAPEEIASIKNARS